MKTTQIPVKNPNIIFRQEDDGYALAFNIRTEDMLTFNETASEIWVLIDGKRSINDIVSILAESYSESRVRIRIHVSKFVRKLLIGDYIEIMDMQDAE
jgi:hypothetical protein